MSVKTMSRTIAKVKEISDLLSNLAGGKKSLVAMHLKELREELERCRNNVDAMLRAEDLNEFLSLLTDLEINVKHISRHTRDLCKLIDEKLPAVDRAA